ncbi:MAG: hypothetical protein KDC46_12270, partial [Thermoleophilia bacterium]|nr:hypothetical protein [Thermoleophilia bacterium]
MVMVRDGGGGAAPKPTNTSADAKRAALKAADHGSTPTPPTSSKKSSSGTTTAFTSSPAIDDHDEKTISRAIRRGRPAPTTTASTTDDKPKPTTTSADEHHYGKPGTGSPSSSSDTHDDSKPSTDKPSENDGRSRLGVRTDEHEGKRDEQIKELRDEQAKIETEQQATEKQIDDVEHQIEDGEGTASTVGKAVEVGVSVATAPVSLVAGLFGHSNPVADVAGDAAQAAAETMLGLQEKRDELKQHQEELDAKKRDLDEQIKKLENEVVLNAITSSMYAVGADEYHVDVMDGDVRNMEVVDKDDHERIAQMSGGDAAYMPSEDKIMVQEEYLDDLSDNVDQLQAQGVLDGDGNVIDAERLDASTEGDQLLAAGALIAVHEEEHAEQHDHGESDVNEAAMVRNTADASTMARRFGEDVQQFRNYAAFENEVFRVAREEMPAYREQINGVFQDWGIQRTAEGTYLTHDADGNELPGVVAAARVFNFMYAGDAGDLDAQMAGYAGHVDTTQSSSEGVSEDAGDPGWKTKP